MIFTLLHTAGIAFAFLSMANAHQGCSRKLSRRVRSFLAEEVFSEYTIRSSTLSQSCPLAPWNDIYEEQEKQKLQMSNGNWKCKFCGKEFKNEMYIDRHMDNMHQNTIGNRTICLGDLCPMLGCRDISPTASEHRATPKAVFGDYDRVKECTDMETARRRSMCHMIADSCSGSSTPASQRLADLICSKLHCENGKLMGAMRATDEYKSNESLQMFFLVLKCVISLFIIVGALTYASSTGVWSKFFLVKSQPSALKNFTFDKKPKESFWYKLRNLVYKSKKDR